MGRKSFRAGTIPYVLMREIGSLIKKIRKWYIQFRAEHEVASFTAPMIAKGETKLSRNTHLGQNCHFNGMQIEGRGKVSIGNNFHSGKDCMIITEMHNHRGEALPYDHTNIRHHVRIGDQVWLGNRVTIIGEVSIGNGAIIQAGAVVVKDIPDLAIAGGSPATVFKMRDRDHYERLLNEKKFT